MKVKDVISEEIDLFELNMSPTSLRTLASNIPGALSGMEFEMCVPNVNIEDDDPEMEPNYDMDERASDIDEIIDFFGNGDNAMGRQSLNRLHRSLENDYQEWADEQRDEAWEDDKDTLIDEYIERNFTEEEREDEGFNRHDAEQAAREEFDDDFDYPEQREWLRSRNLTHMSDIENSYSADWPHFRFANQGDAEMSLDNVAHDFKIAIGKPVNANTNYHGATRDATNYIIEPDASIDTDDSDDGGLEFISPPMPINELLSDLDKTAKWASRYGCYTNKSTGLHINVSVPASKDADNIDYVKLALLLGDEYILQQFGRASNTYCKSAMKIVKQRVLERPEDAKAMLDSMRKGLSGLATKAIHSGRTDKFTSINMKDGYVEFRSPGGDWLEEYSNGKGKIENSLLRFVVALDAATDPEKYRQEYLKKLYAVLGSTSNTDPLRFFAEYSAGNLPKQALKSFIRQVQSERTRSKAEKPASSIDWSTNHITDPYNNPAEGEWMILDPEGRVIHKFTIMPSSQADADSAAARWIRDNTNYNFSEVSVLTAPTWPPPPYQNPATSNITNPLHQEPAAAPTGQVQDYRIYRIGSDDTLFTFQANSAEQARAKFEDWLTSSGTERRGTGFEVMTQAASRQVNGPRTPQPPGTWTGQWLILGPDGREIHRFGGVGNSQSDANRVAMDWLRRTPGRLQAGVEVVPEMR